MPGRPVFVATSEGLFRVTSPDLAPAATDIAPGVACWLDQPIAAITTLGGRETGPDADAIDAIAVTESGQLYRFDHRGPVSHEAFADLRGARSTTNVEVRPTCAVHAGASASRPATTFVGTTGGHVLAVADAQDGNGNGDAEDVVTATLIESFDQIEGRDGWTQPWGAPPDTRSMAVLGTDERGAARTLVVNAHVGGLCRTRDDGATWAQLVDVGIDVHQVAVREPDRIVVATGAQGFGVSRDLGDTWWFSEKGLHGAYCRAVAVLGDDVLLSASTGPFSSEGRLYRRPIDDDGAPFEPVLGGLPESFDGNIDSHLVVTHPDGLTAALVGPGGDVFASEDGGHRWTELGRVPGELRAALV